MTVQDCSWLFIPGLFMTVCDGYWLINTWQFKTAYDCSWLSKNRLFMTVDDLLWLDCSWLFKAPKFIEQIIDLAEKGEW